MERHRINVAKVSTFYAVILYKEPRSREKERIRGGKQITLDSDREIDDARPSRIALRRDGGKGGR